MGLPTLLKTFVMKTYTDLKNELLEINKDLRLIIRTALSADGLAAPSLQAWESTTNRIEKQLAEETIRVALVGSIKSGKSTLTNCLFGGDYVKRGAGVVTSIITRVRPDGNIKATLAFKTWDEVNAEINQALVLFSAFDSENEGQEFDINREKDRQKLQQALSKLGAEQLISEDARDANSVLLIEYLKGYDRAKEFVSAESATHVFESDEFEKQKEFVGDQSLAVYLKDVCLTLNPLEGFGENLEIADCQGSDSPNPLHLAMIQDYLLQTHLLVYVLSSRTGLRQADIKFLTLIKKMGLTKNALFVLNCDLSEHENLDDLKALVAKAEEEIGMFFPGTRVFAFSALYTLFASMVSNGGEGSGNEQGLARKDRLRMEQWREESDMVAFSDKERERFLQEIIGITSRDRFALLLQSNLERISNIASGTREWVLIGKNLLQQNDDKVKEAFAEMDKRRKASEQVTEVIKDTLDGTTRKLNKELGSELDGFFDIKYGDIGQAIFRFLEGYNLSFEDYREELETSGFLPTLYRVFQVLQQATNRFIAESIHPKLVEFIAGEEEKIENVFRQVTGPYSLMIQDAIDQHRRTMEKLSIHTTDRNYNAIRPPEVALTKADSRLAVPRLASTMRYSARIKTEAILRLGFYNTLKTAKKLFKKPVSEGPDTAIRSLEDSARRIKEQMQDSIADHFMDYKENIKYQYIFKLVDAMSSRLYETLTDNMMAFTGNLSDMKGVIENQRTAKGQLSEQFDAMEQSLVAVMKKIENVERLTNNEPL
jgi:GTPase SAR1 family protein